MKINSKVDLNLTQQHFDTGISSTNQPTNQPTNLPSVRPSVRPTYSMEQSHCWETYSCLPCQTNSKIRYRVHNSAPDESSPPLLTLFFS